MTEFDYLVVGGGTAGCIVAARLAEDPAVSVGLVEWGPSDEHEPRARSIRRWAEMLEGEYDLDYRSVPQERGNSGIRQARLRILGGCSTANTMISWRPRVADLREWVDLGAAGWDAATVEPVRSRRHCIGEFGAGPARPVRLERRGRDRGHRLLRDRLPPGDEYPLLVLYLLPAPGPARPPKPARSTADPGAAGAPGRRQPGHRRAGPGRERRDRTGRYHRDLGSPRGGDLRRGDRLTAPAAAVRHRAGRGHRGVGGDGAAVAGVRHRLGRRGAIPPDPGIGAPGHHYALPGGDVGGPRGRVRRRDAALVHGDRAERVQAAQPRPRLDHQRRPGRPARHRLPLLHRPGRSRRGRPGRRRARGPLDRRIGTDGVAGSP